MKSTKKIKIKTPRPTREIYKEEYGSSINKPWFESRDFFHRNCQQSSTDSSKHIGANCQQFI